VIDLEEVAVALDAFPHWDESMRADVFHAIDVAPSVPIRVQDSERYYFGSPAEWAWNRIREFALDHTRRDRWAITLSDASGYESAPTKEEILKALYRGARMIR
jgi:hypothetical protein